MHLKPLTAVLAVSLLTLSPALPIFDLHDVGAAYAKGGGGGGAGGGGGGGGGGAGKSEGKSGKSAKGASGQAGTKKPKKSEPGATKAKGKSVVEGELHPSELGKMNGALNANINAVLAHIRNGQTKKGPVGLLAGLAVADAGAASAAAQVAALTSLSTAFTELEAGLTAEGFTSVEEYLEAKAAGTLTAEQLAAIEPLIVAVGGTDPTGLTLVNEPPTPEEIIAAEQAAAAAGQSVTEAELAIEEAYKKEGEISVVLAMLREKLAPYSTEISEAVATTQTTTTTTTVQP